MKQEINDNMPKTSHNPKRIILPDGTHFEILPIPPGAFMMGSNDEDAYDDENIVHRVEIEFSFCMGKYPVTQALWLAVMGGENPAFFKGMNRPVERVSWYDAVVFCNRLGALCSLPPVYFSDRKFRNPYGKNGDKYMLPNEGEVFIDQQAQGFRLPNETEWEYAARGGPGTEKTSQVDAMPDFKYAGSHRLDETGWYDENSHRETKPVGLKLPNALGLHDMSGNVWEWCNDHWHHNYKGAPGGGAAWLGSEGDYRVVRGGSWSNYPRYCRVSTRNLIHPLYRYYFVGFRLVLVSLPVQGSTSGLL